jgi:SAM-dependent methyltransferase
MSQPPPIETSDYWDSHYQHGNTGWDIGGPALAFVDLLAGPDAPAPGRMIVPGCGRGHDALLFARAGFDVVGIDFAPQAIAEAQAAAGRAGVPVRFELADLFDLPVAWDGTFDYVLEHTCLSAFAPERRPAYAAVVARLLRPQGRYLALFFTHGQPGGPPFGITVPEIEALFIPRFRIEHLAPPARSVRQRQGEETLGLLRLRAGSEPHDAGATV